MVYLVYFLAALFILLGFWFGLSLGSRFAQEENAVGNLIIAHGEEDESPYMFLDLCSLQSIWSITTTLC